LPIHQRSLVQIKHASAHVDTSAHTEELGGSLR